jgi:hypothetical protein
VRFERIPIWKTLPDPAPGPWVEAVRWLEGLRAEVKQLEAKHPHAAQQLAQLFADEFGVSPSMLR